MTTSPGDIFIGGDWPAATEEPIADVVDAEAEHFDTAVLAAGGAFPSILLDS